MALFLAALFLMLVTSADAQHLRGVSGLRGIRVAVPISRLSPGGHAPTPGQRSPHASRPVPEAPRHEATHPSASAASIMYYVASSLLLVASALFRAAPPAIAVCATTGQKPDEGATPSDEKRLPIQPGTGLSLSTRLQLDTMEDLTPQMRAAAKVAAERVARNLRNRQAIEDYKERRRSKKRPSRFRNIDFSWDELSAREGEKTQPATVSEAERRRSAEDYEALKRTLLLLTAAFASIGMVAAFFVSGRDAAISVAVGGLGGVLYQRLLARKAEDDKTAPTLLIPVALFVLSVSWGKYDGPARFGFDLQLLPVILGFLCFRLAGGVVAVQDLLRSAEEEKALQLTPWAEEVAADRRLAMEEELNNAVYGESSDDGYDSEDEEEEEEGPRGESSGPRNGVRTADPSPPPPLNKPT